MLAGAVVMIPGHERMNDATHQVHLTLVECTSTRRCLQTMLNRHYNKGGMHDDAALLQPKHRLDKTRVAPSTLHYIQFRQHICT